jgi:predicted transcriptional regulator
MVAVTTYTVTAKRWAHGWELHIDGIGVTQARSLSVAESTAREYIAFALDIEDELSIDVDVVPQLDPELTRQVRAAREEVQAAARKQEEAAAKQREIARKLNSTGLTGREIAVVLGMSPQRVSQLLGKTGTESSTRTGGRYVAATKTGRPQRRQGAQERTKTSTRTASVKVAGRKSTSGGG